MIDDPIAKRLQPWLSRARARTVLQELLRVPSPQTDLLEAEPLLREFMSVALVPRMKELGMASVRQDAMGNLIAEIGACRTGRSLMLVTHAMNQPPSTMPDPYGGKIIDASQYGLPGEAVLGKGASELDLHFRPPKPSRDFLPGSIAQRTVQCCPGFLIQLRRFLVNWDCWWLRFGTGP